MITKQERVIQQYLNDHHEELVNKHNLPHSNAAIPFIVDGRLTHVVEYDTNPLEPIFIELTRVTKPIYVSTRKGYKNER